jgi:hypothetical protein
MKPILYTTLVTLLYYLALIFAANKIVIKKFKLTNSEADTIGTLSIQMLLAVNINIICLLFLTHEAVMNYMTYLIGDDSSFFKVISSGSVFILVYTVLLILSYVISNFLRGLIGKNSPTFLRPLLWITINLILIKLTQLYYEAYISTQSFAIF